MKFETHDYWKNKRNLDLFIQVKNETSLSGGVLQLDANWMIQGLKSFWAASNLETFLVEPESISDWEPYHPRGRRESVFSRG